MFLDQIWVKNSIEKEKGNYKKKFSNLFFSAPRSEVWDEYSTDPSSWFVSSKQCEQIIIY